MFKRFLISPRDLSYAKPRAWSKQNMEAHGDGGQDTEYIGSTLANSGKIVDYYITKTGNYYFEDFFRDRTGKVVDEETNAVGKKIKQRKRSRQ